MTSNCPPPNFDILAKTLVAVYWIPARVTGSDSEIFFRMEEKSNFKTDISGFISEINDAKKDDKLSKNDIVTVIYITWLNLKQFPGILADVSNKYVSFSMLVIFLQSFFIIKMHY